MSQLLNFRAAAEVAFEAAVPPGGGAPYAFVDTFEEEREYDVHHALLWGMPEAAQTINTHTLELKWAQPMYAYFVRGGRTYSAWTASVAAEVAVLHLAFRGLSPSFGANVGRVELDLITITKNDAADTDRGADLLFAGDVARAEFEFVVTVAEE